MSTGAAPWLAWSACAAILGLVALALLLVFSGWSTPLPRGWIPWQGQAISALGAIGAPVLGALIASRRPENPYGWLWIGFGLASAVLLLAQVYAAYALIVQPGSLPAPRAVGSAVASFGWVTATSTFPFLLLLFPTGRVPSRRWRVVAWTVVGAGVTAAMVSSFMPHEDNFIPGENPLGIGGPAGTAITAIGISAVIVILLGIVLSALSLIFRYRRAGGVERQQLKWFAYAAALFVGHWISTFFYEPPGVWDTLADTVPVAGLYVAVGVAILRYRLYDIDLLINRTLVYGALTVSLILIYVGGVSAAQATFRALTGQDEQSQLAVVASTLAIAALFNPLRRRVQSFVDLRFYRRRYDARKTLEAFSARLRDETDLDALNDELVGVVRETVQPSHATLWLSPDTLVEGEQATERAP